MQLIQANVRPEVVLSYIQNSPGLYNLTPDEIIQLDQQRVDPTVIEAMFDHDRQLRQQAFVNHGITPPLPTAPAMSPVPQPDTALQPAPETAPYTNDTYTNEPPEGSPEDNEQAAGFFYGSLAPYGSWNNLPDQGGWCWQPFCARDRQWKPYCNDGRWCFTDCGWCWKSSCPWGWAAFHYGRWQNDPQKGWRWFPGRKWAPSWVTWRDSGQCIGWAPLPPGTALGKDGLLFKGKPVSPAFGFGLRPDSFTFVFPRNFGSLNLGNSRLGWILATRLFPDTRAFNNFWTAPNGLAMNTGLDVNLVAGDSLNPIPRARILEAQNPQDAGFVQNQITGIGTLNVFRPQISPAPTPSTSINPVISAHTFIPGGQPWEIRKPGPAPTPSTSINQTVSAPSFLPGQPQSIPANQVGQQQAAQQGFNFNQEFPKILPVNPGPPFAPAGTRSLPSAAVGAPSVISGGGNGHGGGGGHGGHG